jgi:hypothetical protein
VEAFDYKSEAFVKMTRFFEDIFRKMEALCLEMWGFYKDLNYFSRLFQINRGFSKEHETFKIHFQGFRGFLK